MAITGAVQRADTNAVLRAAFLAAEEGTAITQELLERAVRSEFTEIGKLSESGALE